MKVIEVTYTWPSETFIQRHIHALMKQGLDISLVARSEATNPNSLASIGEAQDTIPFSLLPNFNHKSIGNKILSLHHILFHPNYLFNKAPLRNKIQLAFFERQKPDLIHFHNVSLAYSMKWIPNKLGIPFTISLRGSDILIFPLRSKALEEEIIETILEAKGIHVVSKYLGEYASKLVKVPLNYSTIYTTINIPPYLPPYRRTTTETFKLLSVGRIHWTKDFGGLMSAINNIQNKFSLNLTLIGNGPEEDRLDYWIKKHELSDKIFLPGKYTSRELEIHFPQFDGYIQSSVSEGLSNSLVEAMAWGVPVFATSVGGTSEVINNGTNGFLLQPFEYDTWVHEIQKIQDINLMEKIRKNAYSTAVEMFNPATHASKFETFYKKATSSNIGIAPNIPKDKENPILIIKGDWIWSNGTDMVLKAIALSGKRIGSKFLFIGEGPQEDELRQIISYFNLSDVVILLPESDKKKTNLSSAIIDISNGINEGWKVIENQSLKQKISFGDIDNLKDFIKKSIH